MASMRQSILSSQASLATAQTELASGTDADIGLTLGGQSGQLLSMTQQQSRLQAYADGNTTTSTRLSSTATALTSLQSAATSFLSTLEAASSSGGSTATLQQAAAANLASLTSTLNTTVAGQALFGGINTATPPMTTYTDTPPSASKQAVDDAFSATFGTSQASVGASTITADQMTSFLNGSFAGLFSSSSYGSTWSSASDAGQTSQISPSQTITSSVSANDAAFRGLAQAYTMVNELTGSTISASAQQAVIQSAMATVSTALTGLTAVQAGVGIAQSAITSANARITAQTNVLSSQSDGLTSVDAYTLNTKITGLQTQIEASYELTNSLQKLSLVNYFTA